MPRSAAPSRSLRAVSRTAPFEIISVPPTHPVVRVLGLLVRLRAEITVLALCLAAWFTLRAHVALWATIAICVTVAVLLCGLPWTRRYLVRRAAAVMTRHRLRQTLVECRVVNFSRACPLFLWARPTRVGETVWLLLRAGISVDDVTERAPEIAAGCFARDARVTARTSMTTLVRVEVIRRDPLAPGLIHSDLGPWAVGWDSPVIPAGAVPVPPTAPTPAASTADDDTRAPSPEHTARPAAVLVPLARNGHRDNDTPAATAEPAAAGRGGDWSDYV